MRTELITSKPSLLMFFVYFFFPLLHLGMLSTLGLTSTAAVSGNSLRYVWLNFKYMGLPFQEGHSSHTAPFYKTEKLGLENRNGRGLYSQEKEIEYKELCDLSLLWGTAGKENKRLKSGDLDINSIFSQWWNTIKNEEYVKHGT